MTRDLTALFDPKSVAVLGASNDETKYGNWLSAREGSPTTDHRAVHLVNRRGESIWAGPPPQPRRARRAGRPGGRDSPRARFRGGRRRRPQPARGRSWESPPGSPSSALTGAPCRTASSSGCGPPARCFSAELPGRARLLHLTHTGIKSVAARADCAPVAERNMALELSGFLEARGHGFSRFVSLAIRPTSVRQTSSILRGPPRHRSHRRPARTSATAARSSRRRPQRPGPEAGAAADGWRKRGVDSRGPVAYRRAHLRHRGVTRPATRGHPSRRQPRQLADTAATLLSYGRHPCTGWCDRRRRRSRGIGVRCCRRRRAVGAEFTAAVSSALRKLLPPSAGVTNPVDLAETGEQDITSSSFSTRCSTALTWTRF